MARQSLYHLFRDPYVTTPNLLNDPGNANATSSSTSVRSSTTPPNSLSRTPHTHPLEPPRLQPPLIVNQIPPLPRRLGRFHQPPRVAAVPAPHHQHHIHL